MKYRRYSGCDINDNAVYYYRESMEHRCFNSTSPFTAREGLAFSVIQVKKNGETNGLLYVPEDFPRTTELDYNGYFDSFEAAQKDAINYLPTLVRGISLGEFKDRLFPDEELGLEKLRRLHEAANESQNLVLFLNPEINPELRLHIAEKREELRQKILRGEQKKPRAKPKM